MQNKSNSSDRALLAPRRTALITGASSGIGLDLAHVVAEHGNDVVLVARSVGKLETLAAELVAKHGIKATVVPADLRDPSAAATLEQTLVTRNIPIDILINNAAFGTSGNFDQSNLQEELDLIQVNITALTELTRRFLPPMLARNTGRVMNVASTAAFQPGPNMATYYASKAYVLHFTEAVSEELRHTGVTLTALCPGPTRTNFAAIASMENTRLFNSPILMNSPDVARYGYRAMMRGTRIAIPGPLNRLVALGYRFAPRHLVTTMSRLTQESR